MIELQHLTKRFATQGGTVVALNDINLTIRDGDVYGIIGMSGAGKSTLVRCINMLERPDEGNVIVEAPGDRSLIGRFLPVKITRAMNWAMVGTILESR
jgi:ABC-type methionine transport system ATPase subunit